MYSYIQKAPKYKHEQNKHYYQIQYGNEVWLHVNTLNCFNTYNLIAVRV